MAERLRDELVVMHETPLAVRAQIGGMRVEGAAEAAAPHRLTRLRMYGLGQRVTDPRVAAPSTRSSGHGQLIVS